MRLITAAAPAVTAGVTLLLSACSQSLGLDPAALALPAPAAETCAADTYQTLVGQLAGEVDTTSLPQPTRVVGSSAALTAEPVPGRMTLVTAGDGRVAQVLCN
jgi:hypothetical protein